ncbi:hypothetical protein [Vreelandella venusta]|nr:hypothetical protein [Halomonas venusta]QPI62401.1 hypothetical protein IR195_10865 [Halomonas venusta]
MANRPLDKEALDSKDRAAQRLLYRRRIAADHKRAELALQREPKEWVWVS